MPTIVLFVQLATESRMEPIELRGSRGRGRLFEWVGSQKRFFTQAVELVVGARSAHAAFDAPDDDGVAAILAPKLGDAIESQKALRLSKRAADTERQHDGVVAAGAALPAKMSYTTVGLRPELRATSERLMRRSSMRQRKYEGSVWSTVSPSSR